MTEAVRRALSSIYHTTPRNVFSVSVTGSNTNQRNSKIPQRNLGEKERRKKMSRGGVHSVTWLLSVPGASNSLMEAVVPYARSALDAYLEKGGNASRSCCTETAVAMAVAARQRAAGFVLMIT